MFTRLQPFALRALAWLLGVVACVLLAAAPARAENVYIMELGLHGIYSVDVVNGGPSTLLTPITPPSTGAQGYTLATRPSDGMLFYLDSNGANPNLWRWDPANPTQAPVLVGTPGASTTGVVRLGFDAAGRLLAMDTTAHMWTLDTNTGGIMATTPLSGDLPSQSGDLCLNTTNGVLYMVANTEIYTVTSGGVSTLLGTISGLPTTGTRLVTGCAFTGNGSLLVSMYGGGSLLRVNLGTLAATALPGTTGIATIGDLATAPERVADLSLTKTASNATPGSTVSFTLTISNAGPKQSTDVRVQDVLPAGLTLTSWTASQGSYSVAAAGSNPAGTWSAGAVPVNGTATLTLYADVVPGTGSIVNSAQIIYSDMYDPDSTPNNNVATEDDQASVTITRSPDLQVSKVANSSFAAGVNGSYAITVSNIGSAPTSGSYTVTDVVSPSMAVVSAAGTGWSCSVAGNTVSCASSTVIAAGGANPNPITLTVQPTAAAAPTVSNTASVAGGGEPASNSGNNTSTVTTAVCDSNCPDLRVNKTLSAASMTVGTVYTYTLSVSNIGGLTTGANSYTITDTLPAGLTLNAAPTAAGWSCPVGGTTTNVAGGTIVSCTRTGGPVLPGGTSPTITFPVNVLNTAVPQVANQASVTGGGEPPATRGNNTTTLTTPVSDFDLTISKAKSGGGNFSVGTNSTYTFTVSNIGTRATTGTISFTDVLPTGLAIRLSASAANWAIAAGWTCALDAGGANTNRAGFSRIFCTTSTASIAAGASTTVASVGVTVASAAAPSVSNSVTVTGSAEAPAYAANNTYVLNTNVNAPDLVITKTHNGSFAVGATESYTLTVSNIGLVNHTGLISVTDTLPAGLNFVSAGPATGTDWTCGAFNTTTRQVTCTSSVTLATNDSMIGIVLQVIPTAAAAAASPVTNLATVTGASEPTGNNGNNGASDTTYVYYPPAITKSFTPSSIVAGGTATLTLTITNPAGGVALMQGLAVSDPFPAGMQVASIPGLANTCGGTIPSGGAQGDTLLQLSGGSISGAGNSCTVKVVVQATGVGTLVNTTGEVSSTNAGIGNTASANLATTAPTTAILTKVSSPNPVGTGETTFLTFTITNKGTQTTNMAFRDTFPANVVVAAGTLGNTCTANISGGAAVIAAAAGTNFVDVSGLDLAGSQSCTIRVPIRATLEGTFTNTSSNVTGTVLLSATAVNDVLVVQSTTLTKSFSPSSIPVGGTSTMALVLTNGSGLPEQNTLAFTESLPAGLVLAQAPSSPQCGGTVTGAVNGTTLALSGGFIPAGLAGCTVTAVVTAAAGGSYVNGPARISVPAATLNVKNSVDATLTVVTPLMSHTKTVAVIRDPVNGTTNPKAVPGAEMMYTIQVSNQGMDVDAGSVVVIDSIPSNTELFVGNLGLPLGPIGFTASTTPAAGLTWNYDGSATDDIDFSSTAAPGPYLWTYVPVPNGQGYDPAVTAIRLNPKGAFAGSAAAPYPQVQFQFKVRIK